MSAARVLVVDDQSDVVLYLSSLLEDNGFEVKSANDAPSAMRVLEEYLPDLILIDVLLPGKSGVQLMSTLRKDPRYGHIPLVVVTGNDQILESDCQVSMGTNLGIRGPEGVLGKPVQPDTLLAVARHLTLDRGV